MVHPLPPPCMYTQELFLQPYCTIYLSFSEGISPLTSMTRRAQSLCILFLPYSYTRMISIHPASPRLSFPDNSVWIYNPSYVLLFPLMLFLPILASLHILRSCLPIRVWVSSVLFIFVSERLSAVPRTSRCLKIFVDWMNECRCIIQVAKKFEETGSFPLWVIQCFVNKRDSVIYWNRNRVR